jgi:two-component system invasion response regulator UvrY
MSLKVLLADDHAVVRQGLKTLLEQAGYSIVAQAETGEQACALWLQHHPDIGLIDLDMPGIGGLEALHRIIARDAHARIVIFSMHSDGIYATRAMSAGARGYVVKTDAPEILLEALQKVMRGGRYIAPDLAQVLAMDKFSLESEPLKSLSPREFEVFRRIADGEPLTVIASQLNIGYKTAANIQTQIRHKLGVQTTGQLVHIAIRNGVSQQREYKE